MYCNMYMYMYMYMYIYIYITYLTKLPEIHTSSLPCHRFAFCSHSKMPRDSQPRLAFANMLDAAVFSILLQRKLPHLQWPEGLKMRGRLVWNVTVLSDLSSRS